MPQYLQDIAPVVLALLDDIATSDCSMGMDDIEDLCEARELLAGAINYCYNSEINRYTDRNLSKCRPVTHE